MRDFHPPPTLFKPLRWRLLLSSLGVMALTLAAAETAVYQYVRISLTHKFDRELATLADAAAHSLTDIAAHRPSEATRSIDNDGDLDIPWQNLQTQQGVEWFRADGTRLAVSGRNRIATPLIKQFHTEQHGGMRALTIPVYGVANASRSDQQTDQPTGQQSGQLVPGYVRVSASTAAMAEELERLRWGLIWGGSVALLVCGFGSGWLTQQALRPIEQSFQRLKQFTADASHELRSPLTAIRTSVEVMQSHPERIHPADVQKLNLIASTTVEMTQLVEDLLLLARADATHPLVDAGWITLPLDELLEELADGMAGVAAANQIQFKTDLVPDTQIQGNPLQLKRLFANLLENAFSYTSANGTVSLSSSVQDGWVSVEVQDTGIGIAPEHLSQIFERFWRADQARSRREGGSGLGLAIVAAIVQTHRGEISVRSQPGRGSCFQVDFPLVGHLA
ncbi:MAG: sensor histidine kinase [Elainella sp.]